MENSVVFVKSIELKHLKSDFIVPRKLSENAFVIAIKKENLVVSFVYFTVYSDYIHLNYSFTVPQYRRFGYSTILRKYLIDYARKNNRMKIVSVPFENASSVSILQRIGFVKQENNHSYVLFL
jgi:GNAT superfamily N-acetyltransferase